MTLPLIYALQQASWMDKRRIIYKVKNESHKPAKVAEVIAFVKESGGLDYATAQMNKYHEEARSLLAGWPASPYRDSLENLLRFTIERQK